MKLIRKLFVAAALSLGFCKFAVAGLFVCNETSQEVAIAIGWKQSDVWKSMGWTHVLPRECKGTIIGKPLQGIYYYRARSINNKLIWEGTDSVMFCAPDNDFVLIDSSACERRTFAKINRGDADQFVLKLREQPNPLEAAQRCSSQLNSGVNVFSKCWIETIATSKQRQILNCMKKINSQKKLNLSLAVCSGAVGNVDPETLRLTGCASVPSRFFECAVGSRVGEKEKKLFRCAISYPTAQDAFTCAAISELTDEHRRLIACVHDNRNSFIQMGLCAAPGVLNNEQQHIASCVTKSRTYSGVAICAFNQNLTPEQSVFLECAATTGGEPIEFATCVGSQLTANELEKCITKGIGGDGCFGENNTAVKFVQDAWNDISRGPGPSNDLLGQDGWVGRKMKYIQHDLTYGPGPSNDIVGEQGFVAKKAHDVVKDITEGPGNTNDVVGKDGWVCTTLFGGC